MPPFTLTPYSDAVNDAHAVSWLVEQSEVCREIQFHQTVRYLGRDHRADEWTAQRLRRVGQPDACKGQTRGRSERIHLCNHERTYFDEARLSRSVLIGGAGILTRPLGVWE